MDYSFRIFMNAIIKFSLDKFKKIAFLKRSLIDCQFELMYTENRSRDYH